MTNLEQEYKWQAAGRADLQNVKRAVMRLDIKHNLEQLLILDSYYDDEQQTLNKTKTALRLRTYGSNFEVTVKSATKIVNGLAKREEDTLPLRAKSFTAAMGQFKAIFHKLLPQSGKPCKLFTIKNRREVIELANQYLKAELCLDNCDIILPSKTIKFYEVELELKKGSAQAFAELAKEIEQTCALKPAKISKVATALVNMGQKC